MKYNLKSIILILSILLLVAVVFIRTCRKAGIWLVKEDPTEHADAIVMLIGSFPDRVMQVADLYEQQISGKILIVLGVMEAYRALEERGVQNLRRATRSRNALVELGIPGDNILILPGDGVSTQMEALAIRDFLATRPEIDSILLVSSAPHMRRASMIFSTAFQQLEQPVEVLCCPSSYTNFNAEKWWRSKKDIRAVVLEYMKLANFILFERKKLRD